MFERFTKAARECVVGARQRAADNGDQEIRSDHLLLATLELTDPVAGLDPVRIQTAIEELRSSRGSLDADSLAGLGIDLGQVRERVEQTFGAGALDEPTPPRRRRFWRRSEPSGWIPFSTEAKGVLERSLREVVALGVREIAGDAILLALLHPESGIAYRAVERSGADVGTVAGRLRERMRPAA